VNSGTPLVHHSKRASAGGFIELDGCAATVTYRHNPRAKRYILRVKTDRVIIVTIPRRGSRAEAERFVRSRKGWLQRIWTRISVTGTSPAVWKPGTEILFRGRLVGLQVARDTNDWVVFWENEKIIVPDPECDLRPVVESHLYALAKSELFHRVLELSRQHLCPVRRITIRNQRSRWGSCSQRGTISLNWRLVQIPVEVRDYVIVHELMHVREMNHSRRFWAHVKTACPEYEQSERWLKQHGTLLSK
jgi:predicted metal-dependent hydrolase